MRIGLLVLSVGDFGKKGFYNLQEVGLGKELGKAGHHVDIYKCVRKNTPDTTEIIAPDVVLHLIGVNTVGNNSFFSCENRLDGSLDVLVCFSDIQYWTTRVYRWAVRHGIVFIPYAGVTQSQSPSLLKRTLINLLARRVFDVYKKTGVLVKTNAVRNELRERGIDKVRTVPVGLDFDLMYNGIYSKSDLLNELRLDPDMKYLLMVGRLESDRNPLDVVTVFQGIHRKDGQFRLVVIGAGSLKEDLQSRLADHGLADFVIWKDRVPNSEMWKYYRVSDALLSFSRTEIFGMSILEAMYYELPVFVIHAPGPDDLILDGETGYLFDSPSEMAEAVLNSHAGEMGKKEKERVVGHFSWKIMADTIASIADSQGVSD